jgi:hypothetical protein
MICIQICSNCGNSTPEGKFCEHCGAHLVIPPAYPPAQSPRENPPPANTSGAGKILIIILILFLGLYMLSVFSPFIFGIAGMFDTSGSGGANSIPVPLISSTPAPKDCALLVTSTPAGSGIVVDGSFEGMTSIRGPVTVLVTAGTHSITISKNGYNSYTEKVTIGSGKKVEISTTLTEK